MGTGPTMATMHARIRLPGSHRLLRYRFEYGHNARTDSTIRLRPHAGPFDPRLEPVKTRVLPQSRSVFTSTRKPSTAASGIEAKIGSLIHVCMFAKRQLERRVSDLLPSARLRGQGKVMTRQIQSPSEPLNPYHFLRLCFSMKI